MMGIVVSVMILLCALLFGYLSRQNVVDPKPIWWTALVYVVIYGVIPVLLLFLYKDIGPRFYWFNVVEYDRGISPYSSFLVILSYICISLSYVYGPNVSGSGVIRGINKTYSRISLRSWFVFAFITQLASLYFLKLYTSQRGASLYVLLQNAGRLRNGESIVGVNDASWTFLSYATCSIFASAVISAIYSEVRSYKTSDNIKTGLFISMLISIGITLLILWLKAGRLHLFNFIVLIFIILTRRVRWQTRLIFAILGFALGYLILTSGKSLFGVQTSNDNVTYFSKIADAASEFGFPVMSLELTTHSVNILWRFFIDYALAPIYVFGLPISAFVFGFVPELQESVAKINTVAFLGTYSSGEIPVDIVTLGYYNMGVIGVVITSLIFGFAMKSINSVFSEHNNPIVSAVKYMIIIYFISVGIMYADPVNFLRDSFYIWMPLLVIAIGSPTLKSRRNIVDVGKSR